MGFSFWKWEARRNLSFYMLIVKVDDGVRIIGSGDYQPSIVLRAKDDDEAS